MKHRMLEERTFLMSQDTLSIYGEELVVAYDIPAMAKEVFFLAKSRDIAKARTCAIDQYFRELGFTETHPQQMKTLQNGYTVPIFRGWHVNLIEKTYRKIESRFGIDPVITAPSALKRYIQKHSGLLTGYSYGV